MAATRTALLIATDTYGDSTFRQLHASRHDAIALAEVLADPEIGDYQVDVLENQPSHEVRLRINELFTEARRDDLILLYFSGHGVKDEAGRLHLTTTDTRRTLLAATAVSAHFVRELIDHSPARKVVVWLDCCFGGAFPPGMIPKAEGAVDVLPQLAGDGRGCAVMTASTSIQFAFEPGDTLTGQPQQSVFTGAIVEGLRTGDADRNDDGEIDAIELYTYVYDHVRAITPDQTPTRNDQVTGELYIARSRRGLRLHPDLPADIRRNLRSPSPHFRDAALRELAELATTGTPNIQPIARDTLQRLQATPDQQYAPAVVEPPSSTVVAARRQRRVEGRYASGPWLILYGHGPASEARAAEIAELCTARDVDCKVSAIDEVTSVSLQLYSGLLISLPSVVNDHRANALRDVVEVIRAYRARRPHGLGPLLDGSRRWFEVGVIQMFGDEGPIDPEIQSIIQMIDRYHAVKDDIRPDPFGAYATGSEHSPADAEPSQDTFTPVERLRTTLRSWGIDWQLSEVVEIREFIDNMREVWENRGFSYLRRPVAGLSRNRLDFLLDDPNFNPPVSTTSRRTWMEGGQRVVSRVLSELQNRYVKIHRPMGREGKKNLQRDFHTLYQTLRAAEGVLRADGNPMRSAGNLELDGQ